MIFLTGYGPPDWGKVSKYCDFTAQSPIDIETASVKKDANLKELRFTADNENGKVSGVIKNNGHAPTLAINKLKGKASLTRGPLGDLEIACICSSSSTFILVVTKVRDQNTL